MFSKLLGSILIILSSVYIGKSVTDKLKNRLNTLKAFERLLCLLEGEISYSETPLDIAFSHISESVNLNGFLPYIISNIKKDGVRNSWQTGLISFKHALSLTDGDIKILSVLSHQLGVTDKDNQVKNIRYVKNLLNDVLSEYETDCKTLTKLYRSMSLSVGIVAVILLI